jgi:hypothetical protein
LSTGDIQYADLFKSGALLNKHLGDVADGVQVARHQRDLHLQAGLIEGALQVLKKLLDLDV